MSRVLIAKSRVSRVYRTEVQISVREKFVSEKTDVLQGGGVQKRTCWFQIWITFAPTVKMAPNSNFKLIRSGKFFGAIFTHFGRISNSRLFYARANFEKIFAPPDSSRRKTSQPGISFTNNEREANGDLCVDQKSSSGWRRTTSWGEICNVRIDARVAVRLPPSRY
jgi:hypothetical protein